MIGRAYLDPGDHLTGAYDPPRRLTDAPGARNHAEAAPAPIELPAAEPAQLGLWEEAPGA